MDPVIVGLIGLAILLLLICLRVPIAFSLGIVGLFGMVIVVGWPEGGEFDFNRGWTAAFNFLSFEPFSFTASFTLVTIPLFLLMGYVAFYAKFTEDLYYAARMWLSGLPGGLAIASVAGCAMFAAVSGSSLATCAAMGRLAVPEMLRYKYNKGLAAGVVAASGTLGSLIPPSILMILYATFTEQSVGKLFIAGIIPGLLSAAIYMGMIWVRASINPQIAPSPGAVAWGERFRSIKGTWPIIILFTLVMGGIYAGIVTPTEAAAVGAAGTWILAGLTKRLNKETAKLSILETVTQTASIFAIVLGAKIFVTFIALTGLASTMSEWALALNLPPILVLFALSLVYIVLGTFMDPVGIMLLTLPVVTPIMEQMGYNLIWFGIIIIKLLEIGLITPPVGLNVYILHGIIGNRVPLGTIFRGIAWFLAMDILTLALLIAFPEISLWLPYSF